MESSEEDAGTATSASCRASAREKDVGLAEDVDTSRNVQHESSEARAPCGTPAMSEDNFDGDSVPSPSTNDTSTDAILDMIDDFIDGPGASRRLPLESQTAAVLACGTIMTPVQSATVSLLKHHESEDQTEIAVPPLEPKTAASENIESLSGSVHLLHTEAQCTPHSEILICADTSDSVELPQLSSVREKTAEQNIQQTDELKMEIEHNVISCAPNSSKAEVLTEQSVIDPPTDSVVLEILSHPPVIPVPYSCEPEVSNEHPVIVPSRTVEQEVVTEQPVTASSLSTVVQEVLIQQPDTASSSSMVVQEVLIEQPDTATSPSTVEQEVIEQPDMASSSSMVEQEVLTKQPILLASSSSTIEHTEQPVIASSSSMAEQEISTAQPVTASSSMVEQEVLTEQPVIASSSSMAEQEISTAQPVTASSSMVEQEVLTEQPVLASTSSTVLPEVLSGQPVKALLPKTEIKTKHPILAPLSSSSESVVSIEEPVIAPLSSAQQPTLKNVEAGVPIQHSVISPPLRIIRPEILPEPLIAPVLNSVETVQVLSDASECENVKSTVKLVTSSENRDNVTVELAESTSSDCSVSESKPLSIETVSRSPLKRRLIRPAPSDRRPDSTVSSTADSQVTDIQTTDHTSCEIITKDVSSSSDAVPHIHGSTKPEEISNVSEINICKAETSTAPYRKIKLVRPKITPVLSCNAKIESLKSPQALEKDQCQSTSSDDVSAPSSAELLVDTSSRASLVKADEHERKPVKDDRSKQQVPSQLFEQAKNVQITESLDLKPEILATPEALDECQETVIEPSVSNIATPTAALTADNQSEEIKKKNRKNDEKILVEDKKVPSIKLSVLDTKLSESKVNTNNLESNNVNLENTHSSSQDDNSRPSLPKVQDALPEVKSNCDQEQGENVSITNDTSQKDHKKVPPIKLNLSGADHSKNPEFSISQKSEESKQVPKLTIKLINKHTEELKCPVPKLTIKPLRSPDEQKSDPKDINQQNPSTPKINIKPVNKPAEKINEIISKHVRPPADHNTVTCENQQVPNITKLNIKPIPRPSEKESESVTKPLATTSEHNADESRKNQQTPSVTKINIKPILKANEIKSKPAEHNADNHEKQQIPNVTKINIKPIPIPTEKVNESISKPLLTNVEENAADHDTNKQIPSITKINIKPIPKPTEKVSESKSKSLQTPSDQNIDIIETKQQIPNVTKINIKPIVKPVEKVKEDVSKSHPGTHHNDLAGRNEHITNITKLNIKPIPKPPEKVNEIHRKSSSSEISESEYSENDESTSTSDQASASDQGPLDTVPKVTIKLGKPGTESEGKFYTEKNIPKLTIKNVQHSDKDDQDKLKLVISQSDDKQREKVPKITIKAVTKSEGQPLSPKLTKKSMKPENVNKDNEIPKFKISSELFSSNADVKENLHVPKITIKPVTKTGSDGPKTPKKSTSICDSSENIPVVTKINIKPVLKPTECGESSESFDEKVPVVSKLNIKPIIKPKDNEVDSSIEDVPKIIKLNIKPLKNPEESSSEEKDCDEKNADMKDNSSIPVVTKLNIKPIVKPVEDEALKDSENQSSETGNSSDENADNIPMVTKLNIKPIVKPSDVEEFANVVHSEQNIPVVTKLNIKPVVKPEDSSSSSPKKEPLKSPGNAGIPIVTKLNIKPIVKPDDSHSKTKDETSEKSSKNPSLIMKINMKNVTESITETEHHLCNNVPRKAHSPKLPTSPKATKRSTTKESNTEQSSKPKMARVVETSKNSDCNPGSPSLLQSDDQTPLENPCKFHDVTENDHKSISNKINFSSNDQSFSKPMSSEETEPEASVRTKNETLPLGDKKANRRNAIQVNELNETNRIAEHYNLNCTKSSVQNYTLLKKLLSTTKDDKIQVKDPTNCLSLSEKPESTVNSNLDTRINDEGQLEAQKRVSPKPDKTNDLKQSSDSIKTRSIQDVQQEASESVTKPLEIITDKITNQSSGQDSPRIILKINKTDHGASAKLISEEEVHKVTDCSPSNETHAYVEQPVNEIPSPKKHLINSRRKPAATDAPTNVSMGKRLRSSRIVESAEKSTAVKRNVNKRPSTNETSSQLQNKESEQTIFDAKRIKLEQLLSVNKSLTITPVISKTTQTSPTKSNVALNQGGKISHNHSLLNNENCSQKNGNSKLHNILSNLQAKQMQTLQLNDSISDKVPEVMTEVESNTSTGSSDVVVEITRVENCHPEVQEMIINENSVCDLTETDEVSQDPLEVATAKPVLEEVKEPAIINVIELTPTPRKRGRPRKLPLPDGAKPPTPAPLPKPALEERPQRSLRLMRERPTILRKPRGGRGRGRGGRRPAVTPPEPEPEPEPAPEPSPAATEATEARPPSPIDPTSSRIKLPRMTEALDKSVAGCTTPLTSRRRSSAASSDLKLFSSAVVLESPTKVDEFMKSPETARPKSGRGSRGGRIRTPRGRGRGRGGGRGAMYMKETMGIYGRVCGPATTTVQLFEEETCMMDDNATPSKPSHLLDEDSQSSVKSSTNDSNKMKKSKFADLFDSNKVWTAADVKEYTWPTPDTPNAEPQVMMIQEQVAMFLGVKSFKRRYPELKRRTVVGDEREYVLSKGVVTEALCDLGITAVDASEVLDIMLSDYPHKYEEYRVHQRERQIASLSEDTTESKPEEKQAKVEIKAEKAPEKPEPPKVDPEKARQEMAAAAIASAAEWNARANLARRPACVDLQSMTIHRRRAPPAPPPPARVRPPHGFYPHALLPGQFQHWYRTYTSEQLRYFPLNTVVAAPPAPPSPAESSAESDASGHSCSSGDEGLTTDRHHSAKRKKLTRVKRSSHQDKDKDDSRGPEPEVDTCRVCKLRLEANRKYTHERFLVCAKCDAKLHPGCVELPTDTIRKCREYAWQCAECKSCCACFRPQDDDKMLFCDLCDRGFHIYCVGLDAVPSGRWHCVECAICKSCGARDPNGLTPGVTGTPGTLTPGPGTPGPSTPGPSTPGPSTPGPSTPGPSTPGPTPGLSSGPGEWHHQTRRGPGGHKVYSHSLCTPCARAYRIGRYCPLCDRSFIGPKGTMQLVICKLCDRQLHQECVRSTVSQLKVLDYTCAECRRGGITSRAAAVRVAPRTIATLFMAKRRFNKYAHRQYMQSRLAALQDADEDDCSVDPLEGVTDALPLVPPGDDSADGCVRPGDDSADGCVRPADDSAD